MTTYDVVAFRAAFENYLQHGGNAPNWANYVIATPTNPTPSGGSVAIPAPHVDSPSTGSDQQVPPPSLQNTIVDNSKAKINTVIEKTKASENVGSGQFGGLPGQYGNPPEKPVIAPAKVVTNVEPIVSIIQPLVSHDSINEKGQFGKSSIITDAIVQPAKIISQIGTASIPVLQPPTPPKVETTVENKMQKVPLTSQQLKDIQTYTDNVTKTLSDAKASGATSIKVFAGGKQIDVFNLNDNTKSLLFASLPGLQKSYGSISLGFSGATQETTTTKKIPLTSDQIDTIHNYTESAVQTVKEAQASGAKNILLLDQQGKTLETIPVGSSQQEVLRTLFADVPNYQKQGKQITLSYTPQMKNVLPKDYTPSYAEDLKTYGSNQVNLFTEVVKGTNEITQGLIDTGKSVGTYIWSGGKVAIAPNVKSDVLSNIITSPIKSTIDSSGKTTTSISVENAKENLGKVVSDIEQNPARQIGRLLPSVEITIGSGLVGEIGSLVKGGSSALGKLFTPAATKGSLTTLAKNAPSTISKLLKPTSFETFVQPIPKITNVKTLTSMLNEGKTGVGTGVFENGLPSKTSTTLSTLSNVKTASSSYSDLSKIGTGVIGKVDDVTKSTNKLFSGEGGEKIVTSTPDKPGKLSYISSAREGSESGIGKTGSGTTAKSETKSIFNTEPTKQESVAKTVQKQIEQNQKNVSRMFGGASSQGTKTTTKTTTKADQTMQKYVDELAGRKARSRQIIASEESYVYVPTGKSKTKTIQQNGSIFDVLPKQVQDIITIPKEEQKTRIDVISIPKEKSTFVFSPLVETKPISKMPTPGKDVIPILDIPTDIMTIPKIPTITQEVIPVPQITQETIPVPTQQLIPVPTIPTNEEIPYPKFGGGFGDFNFNPPTGMTGSFEAPHGSKKSLFVDYDVSEDPLGISNLGKAEYNPYGNKPLKTTQVKVKTPTSRPIKLPKYSLKGMFKMPKGKKKNNDSLFDF